MRPIRLIPILCVRPQWNILSVLIAVPHATGGCGIGTMIGGEGLLALAGVIRGGRVVVAGGRMACVAEIWRRNLVRVSWSSLLVAGRRRHVLVVVVVGRHDGRAEAKEGDSERTPG